MDTSKLLKYGAAAGVGLAAAKYVDEKLQFSADFSVVKSMAAFKMEQKKMRELDYNFTDFWYVTLAKFPTKNAILFKDQAYTFQEVEDLSNRVANWLISKGIRKGDAVALFMENRPEFLIYELGISKTGAEVALINTSIKQKGLLHCVKISGCKMLLFGSELQESMSEVKEELENVGIMVYAQGEYVSFAGLANNEVAESSSAAVSKECRSGIGLQDTFGYIYTSGTTGLPKAAIILHQKMYFFAGFMCYAFHILPSDVIYTCLPLFHSAGGGLGASLMFFQGSTIVIRKKFSATEFWKDCAKYNCTVAQYIGELCRYLVLQPPSEWEKKHHLRMAVGNGLRPEIWDEFQDRFNIPEIGEFYGATEGNSALMNHCKTKEARGACGKFGLFLQKMSGTKIVKFDVVNEEPVRDPNTGFCVECEYGEPGELLFLINPNDPGTKFVGYKNKKATAKKVLKDAFKKGDQYFRTGDLLTVDEKGYFRFVDRIGDTFRWKGENCSTTEVTEVLAVFPGVEEVNVYGVQIPNNMDGRAPTAGITPVDGNIANLDLKGLADHAKKNLPPYAVPLFLRILPQMEVTATMKHQKVKLRTEGIELDKVTDPLYWLNPKSGEYEEFGQEAFTTVTQLNARL